MVRSADVDDCNDILDAVKEMHVQFNQCNGIVYFSFLCIYSDGLLDLRTVLGNNNSYGFEGAQPHNGYQNGLLTSCRELQFGYRKRLDHLQRH